MFVALLGSAVAASLITALFTKAQSDKGAIIDNIIKERKKWRNRLRHLVSDVESCFRNEDSNGIASIEAKLVVLLNPYDEEDKGIIKALTKIPNKWKREDLQEFIDRVAYLLKHDRERVKQESTTRISPQTLALASFVVWLVATAIEWFFDWEDSLQIFKHYALWLACAFFIVAVIPFAVKFRKRPSFLWKKLLCWITNETFREPYARGTVKTMTSMTKVMLADHDIMGEEAATLVVLEGMLVAIH